MLCLVCSAAAVRAQHNYLTSRAAGEVDRQRRSGDDRRRRSS